ncbi:MAG: dihydroorotate dehydrogenase [Synergistaceae bacterium]|nr:dihydroorotate dehydrogenase [Synergistaceae bacterium]
MKIDMSVSIGSLNLDFPVIPASGVWPYEKDFWKSDRLCGIGAVCTKAISLHAKRGNSGIRLWETPAGVLNSIGLQNVGAAAFVEKYLPMAENCPVPVIANVVMESTKDTSETLRILQDTGVPAGAELNISCPNVDGEGMAWGTDPLSAAKAVRAARKVWRGELWVKMTPQTACPEDVARAIEEEGADAIVAANTWLGMGMDMQRGKPAFDRVVAGLSGPAVFPLALRLVWQVCGAVSIPVIGCGGVATASDCAAMMLAGASAVEVGTAFFRNLDTGKEISEGLEKYVRQYRCTKLAGMRGLARK